MTTWTDREIDAMEHDPDEWDAESATVHGPVQSRRSVLSVAFSADDFAAVCEAARRDGLPVSAFVRQTVMRRVRVGELRVRVTSNLLVGCE